MNANKFAAQAAISEEKLRTLGDAERFVLFVAIFGMDSLTPVEARRYYAEVASERLTVPAMVDVFARFYGDGVLARQYKYAHPENCIYELGARFDSAALRALVRQSVVHGWWRIFEADSNSGLLLPNARDYFKNGGYTLKSRLTPAVALRALIDAAGLQVDFSSLYSSESLYWRAADCLACVLDPACAWTPAAGAYTPSNPFPLHMRFLAVLFLRGFDVRPALRDVSGRIAAGSLRVDACDLCELAALGVLIGESFDWSRAKKWEIIDEAKDFLAVEGLLRAGDLVAANKLFGTVFKAVSGLSSLSAPAFNMLAVLVNAFGKPTASRIAQHVRALCPNTVRGYHDRSYAEQHEVDGRNRRLGRFGDLVAGFRMTGTTVDPENFIGNLADPVWSLVFGLKKDVASAEAAPLFRSAEKAFARGYATVAGVYLSTFGWALPAARREDLAALAKRVGEAGGIWFRTVDEAPSEWKRVVSALDERLPKTVARKAASAEKVRRGRIVWALAVWPHTAHGEYVDPKSPRGENFACVRIVPFFRGPRGAEDGSDDKAVSLKAVYGGKYDDCFSAADKTAVAALVKAGYNGPHGMAAVPAAAVEALCGEDNVTSYQGDACLKKFTPVATRLVRQDVPVVGKQDANGVLRLSVPKWCLDEGRPYVLRKAGAPEGSAGYAFHPLSKETRSVLEVFRDYGDGGAIALPKEALDAARPVLGRLAAVLPLQGALAGVAAVGGNGGMARVEGDATPLVRLALEDARLHVSLKVRPVAAASGTLFEPGKGQPERTLALAKGPVILVRDLAREKKSAEAVEKALAEFETWRESPFEWQIDEVESALGALAAIHALGEKTRVEWLPGKRLSVARPAARPALASSLGADQWFAVSGDWKLDDGRVLSLVKLLERFDERVGCYVPIDEKGYLALNRALLRQLEALRAAGQVKKNALAVSPAALPMLDGAFAAEADGMALPSGMKVEADRIRAVFESVPPPPPGFKGVMRPYQEEGYRWLSRLYDCGIGACLADDMGLGKTIQLIGLLAAKKAAGPSLVVAPASVAFNWRNELARFAPGLRVALVGQTPGAGDEDVAALAAANDVVVTSYGVAASRLASFAPVAWNAVILDEAQAIKNHLTQRAKSVKELKARFRVAATGTPVENRLTELWSIFDFINPGMLGGEARFARELAPRGEASPRLKRLVKPLILRRIKREVLTDLPEKEEITVPVVLGEEERTAYEAVRTRALAKLEGEDAENKIAILAELTRLRRFCCHPSLVMPSVGEAAKLDALERLLAGLKENGHRALVFSQFVDFLGIVRQMLDRNGWTHQYLDGQTSKGDREKAVDRFQSGEGDFFLISLKAGGMGLNLTAANYVILLDPWWNPAVENQAADRVHRIGQRLPVTVYRLIAQDTIEEKVVKLHALKTALAEDVLASGASTLTAAEMLDLLGG